MSEIKLAIVIPYYKLTFFEETLRSLSNQTDNRFNLYIGNDKSPENPQDLINKYSSIITKYKEFENNLGGKSLAAQWNRCVDEFITKEEWFIILCDDDCLSSNYVETFYNEINDIKSKDIKVIKGQIYKVDQYNKPLYTKKYDLIEEPVAQFYYKYLLGKYDCTISENIFNVSKYREVKFKEFDLAFGSDIIAVLEISDQKSIYFLKEAKMYFRYSDINISGVDLDSKNKKRKFSANLEQTKYALANSKLYNKNKDIIMLLCRNQYFFTRTVARKNISENIRLAYSLIKNIGLITALKITR